MNCIIFFYFQLCFCLQHYEGDDRIKMFIFDLISATSDGQEKDYRNHTGTALNNHPIIGQKVTMVFCLLVERNYPHLQHLLLALSQIIIFVIDWVYSMDLTRHYISTLLSYFRVVIVLGLSAPVPRGRKGRRSKASKDTPSPPKKSQFSEDISKLDINPNSVLADSGYRKHLERHAIKYVAVVLFLLFLLLV